MTRKDLGITRGKLVEYLVQNNGQVVGTAHELGVSRESVIQWIRELHLWPLVNKLRGEERRKRKRRR